MNYKFMGVEVKNMEEYCYLDSLKTHNLKSVMLNLEKIVDFHERDLSIISEKDWRPSKGTYITKEEIIKSRTDTLNSIKSKYKNVTLVYMQQRMSEKGDDQEITESQYSECINYNDIVKKFRKRLDYSIIGWENSGWKNLKKLTGVKQ